MPGMAESSSNRTSVTADNVGNVGLAAYNGLISPNIVEC